MPFPRRRPALSSPSPGRRGRAVGFLATAAMFAGVAVLTASPASAALDTRLFAVTSGSNNIYVINETTGAATLQPGTLPFATAALARQGAGSNLLYFTQQASPYAVATYNVATNVITTLTGNAPGSFVRLAFRSDGALFGMTGDNNLYQLDPATGAAVGSVVVVGGPSLAGVPGDIAFTPNGAAYIVVGNNLYSVPAPYTSATLVGPTTGDVNAHPNLAFGSGGRLWTASSPAGGNSNVGYLDLSTGAQTTVSTTSGLQFSDMASAPDRNPVAGTTTASTAYNTPVTVDISGVVSDPDGDPVRGTGATVVGGASVGTAAINSSGNPVFSPAVGFSGTATVNYTVSDGVGGSASSTITVTVANAPPAFSSASTNTSQTVLRGGTPVALIGSDPNPGDTVTYSLTSGSFPAGVTLNSNGTFSGTAAARGVFTAQVAITDNHGLATPGTLVITVPNSAPVATSTTRSTPHNTPVTVDIHPYVTDADGDTITVTGVNVTGGSSTGAAVIDSSGNVAFSPAFGFRGNAVVNYTVSDGNGGSASSTITVTVANAAPVFTSAASNTSQTVARGSAPVALAATDPNAGDTRTYAVTAGTLPLGVTLNSDGAFSGATTTRGRFTATVTVIDQLGARGSATLVITVPNVAPVYTGAATNTSQTVPRGGSLTSLAATDADGDTLRYSVASGALPPGVALRSAGAFTGVTLAAGTSTVSVNVSDGNGGNTTTTLTVTVTNAAAPTANPDTATTTAVTSTSTAVLANDTDPGSYPLTVTGITQPAHGTTVLGLAGVVNYRPAAGWSGDDSYTYTIDNGRGGTATGTVSVTVTPTATADAATAAAATPVVIVVLANDSGSFDIATVRITGQPTHGIVTVRSTGDIRYTADFGFSGADTFGYDVSDGAGRRVGAQVTVSTAPPSAPVAAALTSTGAGTTPQTASPSVLTGGSVRLLDGTTPVTALTVAGQGAYTLEQATGVITFTPVANFAGTATPARYRVTDAYGQTGVSTYTPTVTAPAGPVVAEVRTRGPLNATQTTVVTIPPGGAVTLIGPGGSAASTVVVAAGTYALDPTSGLITFTPLTAFIGTPRPVTFRVTDAYGQSAEARYTPVVTGKRLQPTATIAIDSLSVAGAGRSGRALCSVNTGRVATCTVTLTARVNRRNVVIGTGRYVARGAGTAGTVAVTVTLTPLGRKLSTRPGGLPVTATASVRAIGSAAVVKAVERVLVIRPVLFDTAKLTVHPVDVRRS